MAFIEDLYHDELRNGYLVKADIKKVWNRQLEIWQEVDKICRKHGITYWAAYGTLIGAARHKGFIPWDEDLDLCMMRPDFDRFRAVVDDELGDSFSVAKMNFMIAKILHNETSIVSRKEIELNKIHGIIIDIFPLDIAPDDTQNGFFAYNALNELLGSIFNYPKIIEHVQNGGKTVNDFSVLENLANKPTLQEKYDIVQMYAGALFEQSSNVAWIEDSVRKTYKYPMKKAWFDETIYLPFETVELPAPKMFDEVLTSFYGDWRTPVVDGQHKLGLVHSADIPWREFIKQADLKLILQGK